MHVVGRLQVKHSPKPGEVKVGARGVTLAHDGNRDAGEEDAGRHA